MRVVMLFQPKSNLAKEMQKHLVKGLTVPDELAVQALELCLLDMRCQTRGYVYIPNSVSHLGHRCIAGEYMSRSDQVTKEYHKIFV